MGEELVMGRRCVWNVVVERAAVVIGGAVVDVVFRFHQVTRRKNEDLLERESSM